MPTYLNGILWGYKLDDIQTRNASLQVLPKMNLKACAVLLLSVISNNISEKFLHTLLAFIAHTSYR